MASSTISRRAFLNLSSKYPNRLTLKPKRSKPKDSSKDESPWPKSLQIAGYAAVAASIPYSLSVIVAESAAVRAVLEENGGNFGQSTIKWVRWYWGHEEEIPYSEFVMETKNNDENGTGDDRLQMHSEDPPTVRYTQAEIQKTAENPISFRLISEEGIESTERMPGNTLLSDSKILGGDRSKRLIISFDENEESDEESAVEEKEISILEEEKGDHQRILGMDLMRLTTTWSSWNDFTPNVLASTTSSTVSATDSTKMKIDELSYNISELQKNLQDSSCTRNRDDMEIELQEMKIELKQLKRNRWIHKLKSIWS